ncbi:MAG: HAMP domain-containing histidine kinase [Actinomycetota bacterium]|nr:HAMP domain-containing histidine kinase [Actinomycetota bacterium]
MGAIRARAPAGLRWRLTAWVAAVMLVSVAVIFVAVYDYTGTQLRSEIDRDLAGDTSQLLQSLNALQDRGASQITAAAARYVRAQPYSATSILLFVLVSGEPVASNHGELFGIAVPEAGESAAEQAKENGASRALQVPRVGYSTRAVPDVGRFRILERSVRSGYPAVVVGAGEPLAVVERAEHGLARSFVLAGALTLALALLASYLAGVRVSAPLRRMAAVATRVDAGDLEPRMDGEGGGGHGGEVEVLAQAFNHMLDRLAEAFAGQKEFIADASHELRTPLTVIRGQLEVLAAQHAPAQSEVRRVERLVQAEITRISRLVDDMLVLAATEQTGFLREEAIDVRSFVAELWDGVSLTAARRFELGPVPKGSLFADPDRLAQALRNLAGNAVSHTTPQTGLVRLEVQSAGHEEIRFVVLDDGPGIPASERERIFERFHRTDPGRSRRAGGAGLGLAIVRAIAQAHGGEVRAGDSGHGRGARVELVLPGFRED